MPVAAVVGSPIAQSLSPALHRAAFASAGLDWEYVAFDVPVGAGAAAVEAMRTLGLAGLSVTTPLKAEVAAAVDRLAPAALALNSVNTVVRDGGELVGHSTDGDGFVASLSAVGVDLSGCRVAVVGAGGAARSLVDAIGRAGAAEVVVVNRTPTRGAEAARLAPTSRTGEVVDLASANIVVNATSVGMATAELPFDPTVLRPEQIVVDLVYHPLETALLRAAERAGCRTLDGLGMLVHQAVLQQELWTGRRPDPTVMRAAALAELDRRAAAHPSVSTHPSVS
ncbi:shikimate dehydrogenase [soil metagenome]